MANENLTSTTQVDSGLELYYDRTLLENARALLHYGRFADQKPLPRKSSKTIKFRRYSTLSVATTPLTEGITPPGSRLAKTDLLATTSSYGDYVHITDIVDMTVEDPVFTVAAEELGDQMLRTLDQITRDYLISGVVSVTTASSGSPTPTLLNRADINSVVQTLVGANAKMITKVVVAGTGQATQPVRAAFWGICHTDLLNDLENVSGFVATANYANQQTVLEGEWGVTGNVRWLLSSVADSSSPYSCLIIGQHAYGVVDLQGGNAKNIRKEFGSGGTADPLNQRASSGWKVGGFVARILNDAFIHDLQVTNA